MRPPDPENGNAPLVGQRGAERTIEKPCADHSAKPRPFIHRFRSGVMRAPISHTVKCLLLVLAEFADSDGGSCYPSMEYLSWLAGMNERTARRILKRPCPWFERVGNAGVTGGRGWATYVYALRIPDGADTRPARWGKLPADGPDSVPAPVDERAGKAPAPTATTCGHSAHEVRTFSPDGAGTMSDDVGFEIGKSRLEESAPADAVATPADSSSKKPKRRQSKSEQTFKQWIDSIPGDDPAIRPEHAVFAYGRKIGLPEVYLDLAWCVFQDRYEEADKKYRDWPAVFLRAVRENWFKLWARGDSGFYLTTAGQQASLAHDIAGGTSGGYVPLPGEI